MEADLAPSCLVLSGGPQVLFTKMLSGIETVPTGTGILGLVEALATGGSGFTSGFLDSAESRTHTMTFKLSWGWFASASRVWTVKGENRREMAWKREFPCGGRNAHLSLRGHL